MKRAMKLSDTDNVATLLDDIAAGETAAILDADKQEIARIQVLDDIRRGHKTAVRDIPKGTKILKYGQIIGGASEDIRMGELVHTHNLESLRGRGDKA